MTRSSKQVYTYTEVKDVIFHKLQKYYVYEVASSLRDIEAYDMEGKRPTRISLDMDTNTRSTNQIVLDILYQVDITDYINRSIYFKQNLRKLFTVVWELCNKSSKIRSIQT